MRICSMLCCALALVSSAAMAQDATLSVELPKLNVAEYHKPYLAIWLEDAQGSTVTTLGLWYDAKMRNNEGEKWLKDMRQWWRKTGRSQSLPMDGVTGATKGPGAHPVHYEFRSPLPAGQYVLNVEAAREVGGREQLRIAFSLPQDEGKTLSAQGSNELGKVTLRVNF